MAELVPDLSKLLNGNDNDILLVANPDIDCEDFSNNVVINSTTREEIVESYAHKEYFEVKWAGKPHRIVPNNVKRMPRWLAKHFAKHLTDHLLQKEDVPINHATRRPQIIGKILLKVDEYFEEVPEIAEGAKVLQRVEELNVDGPTSEVSQTFGSGTSTELGEMNVGKVADPTLGELRPPSATLDEVMKEAGKSATDKIPEIASVPDVPEVPTENKTSIYDTDKPKPTKSELLKEAFRLDIPITGRETVDQLISKIRAF